MAMNRFEQAVYDCMKPTAKLEAERGPDFWVLGKT
jgi:hypothetical protein